MQKTVEIRLSEGEAARIEAAIAKCDHELKRIFKEMKRDQAEIEKLRNRTRATLARILA